MYSLSCPLQEHQTVLMSTVTWSLREEGVPQGCALPRLAKWKMFSAFGRGFTRLKRALGCGGSRGLQYQSLGLTKASPTLGLPIVCIASGWGKEPNPQIRDSLPGQRLALPQHLPVTPVGPSEPHCREDFVTGIFCHWGDPTHMLGVGWEVGLFRDKEQVLRGQGSSVLPLGVGSLVHASASHVFLLLVFLSHLCEILG